MHPAYSVIVFTTASGAGYGLLIWLAVGGGAQSRAARPGARIVRPRRSRSRCHRRAAHLDAASRPAGAGLARALAMANVVAVARRRRRDRDLSAGRRAGLGWVFGEFVPGQIVARRPGCSVPCALATLWCTGMIYASLPTIRAWHQPLVAPLYLVHCAGDRRRAADIAASDLRRSDPLDRRGERGGPACSARSSSGCTGPRSTPRQEDHTAEAATGLGQSRHGAAARPAAHPAELRDARDGLSGGAAARREASRLVGDAAVSAAARGGACCC